MTKYPSTVLNINSACSRQAAGELALIVCGPGRYSEHRERISGRASTRAKNNNIPKAVRGAYLGIPPADQRRETYNETENPEAGDQHFRPGGRHDARIGDRASNGHVTVQGDGT